MKLKYLKNGSLFKLINEVNEMDNVYDVDIIRDFSTSFSLRSADSMVPSGFIAIIKIKEN